MQLKCRSMYNLKKYSMCIHRHGVGCEPHCTPTPLSSSLKFFFKNLCVAIQCRLPINYTKHSMKLVMVAVLSSVVRLNRVGYGGVGVISYLVNYYQIKVTRYYHIKNEGT